MTFLEFLRGLYTEMPENQAILIWSKQGGSYWAKSFEKAEEYARILNTEQGGNVYYGICLATPKTNNTRAKASEVTYAPALWVDIDIKSAHHSKQNLPGSIQEAWEYLLETCPLRPSAKVETGGGLHAYWFLKELFELDDDGERLRFASVIKGWQSMIRTRFRQKGWDVDATHDLARVLRVPCTYNWNAGVTGEVTDFQDDIRYDLSDFEPFVDILSDEEAEGIITPTTCTASCFPYPSAELRPELQARIDVLCEFSAVFAADWAHNNPNLPDDSQSSYDMSMADIMALEGDLFTDQDICDVLVANRLRYATTESARRKTGRADYYRRTISAARSWAAGQDKGGTKCTPDENIQAAENDAAHQAAEPSQAQDGGDQEPAATEKMRLVWDMFGAKVGLKVESVILYTNADPEPEMNITGTCTATGISGTLRISMTDLRNKTKFDDAFFMVFRDSPACFKGVEKTKDPGPEPDGQKKGSKKPGPMKPAEWRSFVTPLGRHCIEKQLDGESTTEGILSEYITNILYSVCGTDITKLPEEPENDSPFMVSSRVYMQAKRIFADMLLQKDHTFSSTKDVANALRTKLKLGIMPRHYRNRNGEYKTVRAFEIPKNLWPTEETAGRDSGGFFSDEI